MLRINPSAPGRLHKDSRVAASLFVTMFMVVFGTAFVAAFGTEDGAAVLAIAQNLAVATLAFSITMLVRRAGLYSVLVLFAYHTTILMVASHWTDGSVLKVLLATKEFFAVGVLLALVKRWGGGIRWQPVDWVALLFLGTHLIYFIAPVGGSLIAKAVSFREGAMIVVLYGIGRLGLQTIDDLRSYTKFAVWLAVSIAAFGLTERFLFTAEVWGGLGALEYFDKKFGNAFFDYFLLDGLPAHWFSYLGEDYFRRLVGPVGDATSLSRFLSFPILAAAIKLFETARLTGKVSGPLLCALLLLSPAILLTIGRGGLLIFVIGLMLYLFRVAKPLLVFGLIMGLMAAGPVLDANAGNLARHLAGLSGGLSVVQDNFFGIGLGVAGQMAATYASSNVEARVLESYIGALATQLGVPGLLTYFLLFLMLAKKAKEIGGLGGQDGTTMQVLGSASVIGIFLTSFLAQSAVSPISIGISMIFIGGVSGFKMGPRKSGYFRSWRKLAI